MDPNNAQNNQSPAPVNPSPIPGDGNDPSQPVMPPENSQTPVGPTNGGKKKVIIILIVVLVLLAVAGALVFAMKGKDSDKDATPTTPATPTQNQEAPAQTDATEPDTTTDADVKTGAVAVTISNFAFSPSTLKVKKGSTITWTNNDSAGHTVTSDDDSTVSGLDSELLAQGKTFSFTFDKVGIYSYHCTPHPNMTATVEVVE